jgi:hypothetical protein
MNKLFTIFVLSLCAASALCAVTKDKQTVEQLTNEDEIEAEIGLIEQFMDFLSLKEKEEKIVPVNNEIVNDNQTLALITNATKHKRQAYGGGGYGMPPPQQQQQGYGGYGMPPQQQGFGMPPQQQGFGMPPPPPGRGPGNQIMDGGMGGDLPDFYDFYPNDFLYDYYNWVCSDTSCLLCNILTSECCNPDVNVNCFLPDSCLNNPCLSGGTCIPTVTPIGEPLPDFICVCNPGFTGKYCQLTNEFFFPPMPPPPPPPMPAPYPQPQYNYQPPQPQYQPPQPQYQPPAQAPYQQPPPQVRPPAAPQAPSYGGPSQNGPIPRK